MITKNTVIIIGAGGSKPYGYPSGEELIKNIISNFNNQTHISQLIQSGVLHKNIQQFAQDLKGSNLKSIDRFLEHKTPDERHLGKLAIAQELIRSKASGIMDTKDDWYKEIWNKMHSKLENLSDNKIAFITFNYDLSLEKYLFFSALSTYHFSSETIISNFFSSLPIIHLHGKIGAAYWEKDYQVEYNDEQLDFFKVADGIKIISEAVSEDIDFIKAHSLIQKAERIYFIGFGYDPINIERLKIKDYTQVKTIEGSSFGLTDMECVLIEKKFGRINTITRNHHWKNLQFMRERVILD